MGRAVRPTGNLSAFQRLQDQLKWVDLIFEVRDARVPESSRHPKSEQIFGQKPRIVVLCKEDLADPAASAEWLKYFKRQSQKQAMFLSLKRGSGKERLIDLAVAACSHKLETRQARGLLPRPVRACVVGMPNVGKSSLINWLIGRKKAQTGDRPGITKGPQWVRLHPQLELLDTPGILPPVAFSPNVKLKLALLNLLPDNLYDLEEVSTWGIAALQERYKPLLEQWGIDPLISALSPLEQVAKNRNCLASGGILDTRRAAGIFINDLRDGKLGRITLDVVEAGHAQK
jgi:ribosome biogenesis GTPase A